MKSNKNFQSLLIIVMSGLWLGVGCKKHDQVPISQSNTFFSEKIIVTDSLGGTHSFFVADTTLDTSAYTGPNGVSLKLTDYHTNTTLTLDVNPKVTAGTYTFGSGKCQAFLILNGKGGSYTYSTTVDVNGDSKPDGAGTITIIQLTKNHIKGTYNIIMYNTHKWKIEIQNGAFDCLLWHY